jgi:hypothetical protein
MTATDAIRKYEDWKKSQAENLISAVALPELETIK